MSNYFFVLGSHPAISTAEIFAFAKTRNHALDVVAIGNGILVVSSSTPIDCVLWQKQLGGTIKTGKIIKTINQAQCLPEFFAKTYLELGDHDGKNIIGFSAYATEGETKPLKQSFSLETKKLLKQAGLSVRMITTEKAELTSVQVDKNKLIEKGAEFVLVRNGNEVHVGATKAVQAFEHFNKRDYGRPAHDDFSGMLPPKLARMMVNLSKACGTKRLLDPFCGSGTVLTEALDLGIESIVGSDISDKAIEQSQKNVDWMQAQRWYTNTDAEIVIFKHDATKPFAIESVDAVIGETYLGPARGLTDKKIPEVKKQVNTLLERFGANIISVLKDDAMIVLAVPMYKVNNEWITVNLSWIKKSGLQLHAPLSDSLMEKFSDQLSTRGNLMYARATSRVGREILLLSQ